MLFVTTVLNHSLYFWQLLRHSAMFRNFCHWKDASVCCPKQKRDCGWWHKIWPEMFWYFVRLKVHKRSLFQKLLCLILCNQTGFAFCVTMQCSACFTPKSPDASGVHKDQQLCLQPKKAILKKNAILPRESPPEKASCNFFSGVTPRVLSTQLNLRIRLLSLLAFGQDTFVISVHINSMLVARYEADLCTFSQTWLNSKIIFFTQKLILKSKCQQFNSQITVVIPYYVQGGK